MRYFFVFQKTFDLESSGGYLWAPKSNPNGRRCSHWINMKNVKAGDIIFSGFNKNIVAISIATSDCYDCDIPQELKSEELWNKSGMKVDCKYFRLSKSLAYKDLMNAILKLQPPKYAPFNKLGRGNTGYLFDLTVELAEYFLSVLNNNDKCIIDNLNLKISQQV